MKTVYAAFRIALILALPVSAIAQDSAADLYKTNCAPCHGVSGDANTPAGKNFKATAFTTDAGQKKSDKELLAIARNGKGQMPPWADVLTDTQLKGVIEYIRTLHKH